MPRMKTKPTADLCLIRSGEELRRAVEAERRAQRCVGLVPTMGALHAGHLSLVEAAQAECDVTVVTIFVNPAQFGPREDLRQYPRSLDEDLARLSELGVAMAFVPEVEEVYPPGFSTFIEPPRVAQPWEGRCRPGHFRGVATVVFKLFQMAAADIAYFGEKDYQQYLVIRQMAVDLNLPMEIRACPIVREADGLAMSSRNRYLDAAGRRQAAALSRSLEAARELFAGGQRNAPQMEAAMRRELQQAGITRIDYAAICHPQTLEPLETVDQAARALLAAYIGPTRLIDNCSLP